MTNIKNNWHGLVKILNIEHRDVNGSILWRSENIHNLLHSEGEFFILSALFDGGAIPANYYFGMDIRTTIAVTQTISDLIGQEVTGSGYARQEISSSGDFVISETDDLYYATSPILSFSASSGSWSANNLFLTNQAGYSGKLIASVPLGTTITVNAGQIVSVKMSLSLRDSSISS
jgi:hypothetical protein